MARGGKPIQFHTLSFLHVVWEPEQYQLLFKSSQLRSCSRGDMVLAIHIFMDSCKTQESWDDLSCNYRSELSSYILLATVSVHNVSSEFMYTAKILKYLIPDEIPWYLLLVLFLFVFLMPSSLTLQFCFLWVLECACIGWDFIKKTLVAELLKGVWTFWTQTEMVGNASFLFWNEIK